MVRRNGFGIHHVMAMIFAVMLPALPATAAQNVDPADASKSLLQRTTSPQRDGSHLSMLFALRQIHDPDLQPFFSQLVASPHWQIQVHGVLGLAEISESGQIDPAIISQLAPAAQDAVIATALDLDMLPPELFDLILASEELQPMARLVLLAELVLLNKPVNRDHLMALSNEPEDTVAGLSSCLLMQLGEPAPFAAFRSRLAAIEARRRDDVEVWIVEAIRRYKLTACVPWLREFVDRKETPPEQAYRGVFALLELDEPVGMAAWAQLLGSAPSYQQKVKFALLLLASKAKSTATAFNRLNPAPDEELLIRLIAVGRAISNQTDLAGPLLHLLEMNHLKSIEWAMEYIATLPDDVAARIYGPLIDRLESNDTGEQVTLAVAATTRLFKIDSSQVFTRLRNAPDDGTTQQAILLGLLESNDPAVGEAARTIRRIGSGRADSLALLLMAKHIKNLDKADIDQLGTIASGGGRVSEVLQAQAAWMYLKHIGQAQQSIALCFPEVDPKSN